MDMVALNVFLRLALWGSLERNDLERHAKDLRHFFAELPVPSSS